MEQNGKIAISKRRAWRDLHGYAAPTGWMSDDELERLTPRMVSVKQIQKAVRLANAAPELLEALQFSYEGHCRAMHRKECTCKFWDKARAAIAKATGQLTPAQREQGATLAQEHGV